MINKKSQHVEMIIDYITDGADFTYSDNCGVLIRCRNCRYFDGEGYCYSEEGLGYPKPESYCSFAEGSVSR